MPLVRDEFLTMLRCPVERQSVSLADDALVQSLNAAISAGRLKNKGGDAIAKPIDGALVRQDRVVAYPIVDGIPVMLADEAIVLDQVASSAR
ncbi:MAG: hypothetical protein JNM18_11805 [Planctomycetaceae bacterium]|nr:hypothetical protein [Planctomycetaceae bacterium]